MPTTKPDLEFDSNQVCSGCINFENRKNIDWDKREKEFMKIIQKFKNNGSNWDCIIPVSGGKDSTYQVIKALSYGLNPLCVTGTTCDQSDLGYRNLQNIRELGVDHLQVSFNPKIRRIINKTALKLVGDISWPEHIAIFTVPIRVAVQYNVPLIVWGENSQNEYGGPLEKSNNKFLDRSWLEEFGGLLGLRVSDLVGVEGIKKKDLLNYTYPDFKEIQKTNIQSIFLGHFFKWDGLTNAIISQAYGFESFPNNVENSMANYENLDNHQTGIHDYFKYLKFGFGRTTDIVCNHIRRGRITRKEGFEIIKKLDGKFPWIYLGKRIEEILKPLDISLPDFIKICDKFTNKNIFKKNNRNELLKDKDGNLSLITNYE